MEVHMHGENHRLYNKILAVHSVDGGIMSVLIGSFLLNAHSLFSLGEYTLL